MKVKITVGTKGYNKVILDNKFYKIVPEHPLQTGTSEKVQLIKIYLLPKIIFRDK